MLQKLQNRKESGFTIIEVLIVLAIAGLILLIVFLAVPALERSQRNNGRKNDASRISTGVGDFVSNSNGNLPANVTDLATVMSSAGSLSQYSDVTNYSVTAVASGGAAAPKTFYLSTAGVTYAAAPTATGNSLILDENQQCASSAGTTQAGTARQAALLYSVESGSSWSFVCLTAQ